MESLTPESKTLYELLKVNMAEDAEQRFAHYKKEILGNFQPFVMDTQKHLKGVDQGMAALSSDLEGVRTQIGQELDVVRGSLSHEIGQLTALVAGLQRYYRKFIKHYAIISQPLTALLKKGTIFVWTIDTDTAFQTLKKALITAPVLALPRFSEQFVIDTDACDVGIGAVLSQGGHPLAYVPVRVLQQRARQVGRRTVAQVLVQWSGSSPAQATWEDQEALQQHFPLAPAWGQAGLQQRGNVSDPVTTDDQGEGGNDTEAFESSPRDLGRPKRSKRPSSRYAGDNWTK
ncbi:hypothetical protein QYE76_012069 [Lolium multiflorum]|uniref:Chromo domain-containing protein n=1 Tax=Lolium multiflorum TaxID=4521 RepID=A0AAD8X5Y3_LOLMU|nr:hypothetical protein QYE76_012069 [Lolium multiflorum]